MYSRDELYNLILNDAKSFNNTKEDDMDLSEFDFSNQELNDIDFSNSEMIDSTFLDSTLTKCSFVNCDLTSVDFTRTKLIECDFSEALLNGTNFSYAQIDYSNFSEADMAGAILLEATFTNTDLSTAENLQASRFDDTTCWPDDEYLPDGFDSTAVSDLSSLQDDEEYTEPDY